MTSEEKLVAKEEAKAKADAAKQAVDKLQQMLMLKMQKLLE